MSNFTKPNSGVLRGTAMALTDLPSIATGTALANISGSSTTPTAVSLVSTATASSIMLRDTNANVQANNLIDGYNTTVTAAGTTTLTVGSECQQFFTGTTTQTVVLPVTSTLVTGMSFIITNLSTGIVTVQSSGANTVLAQAANTTVVYTCILTSGTTAASWNATLIGAGGAITPTVTTLTSGSGTFTTPANASYLIIKMVGGGGGGGGTGTSTGPGGSQGGSTSFNSITAVGGSGGYGATTTNGASGGAGGTGGSGSTIIRIPGQAGFSGPPNGVGSNFSGAGGASILGFGGAMFAVSGGGYLGQNYGGGGAGGGGTVGVSASPGGGGGGEYAEFQINSPTSTYTYSVGSGGAGGIGTGSGAATGGAGGSGYIEITTYYNNGAVGTATNITLSGTAGQVLVSNGSSLPTFNGPVGFSVNTSTTVMTANTTPAVYTNVIEDTNSGYNASTGVYTIPAGQGGLWLFTASMFTATSGPSPLIKDGSTVMTQGIGVGSGSTGIATIVYQVSAGDPISVQSTTNTTLNNSAIYLNSFSGCKIR